MNMAIETLQNKIRKLKNPSMLDLRIPRDQLPQHLLTEEGSYLMAYCRFCRELLQGLKGIVPAVRFSFDAFALLGGEGLHHLSALMQEAGESGYYVLLDGPQIVSPLAAEEAAETFFASEAYPCDGLLIEAYIGTDAIKPFVKYCKNDKDLFVVLRSSNKSASELQDLMNGNRLVHYVAADLVSRTGESIVTRSGYSRICGVLSATAANSIRAIRGVYKSMFLMVDGLDAPSGNHKNCSYAFDRMGHGAVVCAGLSLTAAWKETESDGRDFVSCATQAAERMRKLLTGYVPVL